MVHSREDLRNQLKRREIAPVYLLFGPETHLRDVAAKTIADLSFAEGDMRDFNETNFSLNTDDTLKRALAAAQQLPMMSQRRVIRITDVRITATGFRDTITEEHEPVLSAYIGNPALHSIVIFIADELNGVRKMGKFLRDKTTAVEFTRLDDRELSEMARSKFIEAGAHFIVSPILKAEMATVCKQHDKLWIPGCATLTEIVTAKDLGAKVIKIFPGSVLGPGFVSAIMPVVPGCKGALPS